MDTSSTIRGMKKLKQTLVEIIRADGATSVAAALGVSRSYVFKLQSGSRPASRSVMKRALEVYGERLDVERSLLEEVNDAA